MFLLKGVFISPSLQINRWPPLYLPLPLLYLPSPLIEGYSHTNPILVSTYGKPTVVENAHIKCITSLPIITGTRLNRVHQFYEELMVRTQALDTMNKLKDVNGYIKLL